MKNFDITFCTHKRCKNLNCERNQNNLDKRDYIENHIWVGDFVKCENFKKRVAKKNDL